MRYHEIVGSKIVEEKSDPDAIENFNPAEDKVEHKNLSDTRKPKLTLKMINRLKKIRATKDLEMVKKEQFLGVMYGQSADDDEL